MDELGQKLLYTSLELEKLKSEAMEEMQKNKEYVNQLIQLLKLAIQERDEARNQLDKLIISSSAAAADIFPATPQYFHGGGDSPILKPARANSSITESNSLSETLNYHSPTVDSLFDAAISPPPEIIQDHPVAVDRGTMVVESLSKGRPLPRKGMLLQAVLEAGPLLQMLMVAGPLPRWRNPPQMQPFQVPSAVIGGSAHKPVESVSRFGSRPDYGSNNCMKSGIASLISSAISGGDGCFRLPKRQRFC